MLPLRLTPGSIAIAPVHDPTGTGGTGKGQAVAVAGARARPARSWCWGAVCSQPSPGRGRPSEPTTTVGTVYEGIVQDLIDELGRLPGIGPKSAQRIAFRSEEHTSELQSRGHLVCRLLHEKKN